MAVLRVPPLACGYRREAMEGEGIALRCAWCGEERPDDDERCRSCGNPRFRHKTADPDEFWDRQRELDEHGR
jgi:ribosomal protein L40E